MEQLLEKMANFLVEGKMDEIKIITQQALDEGITAKIILDKGLLVGMNVVGQRFKAGDMFIPEVLLSANCMHAAMDLLKPLLSDSDADGLGIFVIGTVHGDLHDIGKNLVAMMLQGAGFKVIDLGIDIPTEKFIEAVKENRPKILGLSALLSTTLPKMEEVVKALSEAGLRDQVKIMIGGAPVTEEFSNRIGADGYAENAASAVDKAKELVNGPFEMR